MTVEQEDKARARRTRILSWVIVALMVFSVLGFYIGSSDTQSVKYNGTKFTATSQGIIASIQGKRFVFNYYPAQVESIPTDPEVKELLKQPALLVTYDPASNYSQTMAQVQYYFQDSYANTFGTYIIPGITQNTTFAFPIITCANATSTQPVLAFVEDNETSIRAKNSCIIASAQQNQDLLRITDKLALLNLGVLS